MVEDGETIETAQQRELYEETALQTLRANRVYETDVEGKPNRASHVVFFAVDPKSYLAQETEVGCAVTWMSSTEILEWSPFREWYAHALNAYIAFLAETVLKRNS